MVSALDQILQAGGVFVTATDTEAGKTVVSRALLDYLNTAGHRAVGYKPIASGADETADGLRNEDALIHQAHSHGKPAYSAINPLCFEPAIAPHIAAQEAGQAIDPDTVLNGFQALRDAADLVVVEGVGGWRVPLADGFDVSDLALRLQLPVLLVVGLRLGCINHARLTAESILASGAPLLGWLGNTVDPEMARPNENIATLKDLLPAPCLGILPHLNEAQTGAQHLQLQPQHP